MSSQVSANPFFSPIQISGCAVWLDAFRVNGQTMATNNSLVSSWVNLVNGGSNFSQTTSSRQPTFLLNGLNSGYPSIYFNSSTTAASIQYLFAGPNVQTTRDASVFYVSKYTDVGTGEQTQIDQRKDATGVALRTFKAAQYQIRDPASNLYTMNYTSTTSPSIKSYRDTLNTSFGYLNGTQVTSSSSTYDQQVADNNGIFLGCHFQSYTNDSIAAATFAKVFISEVLIYNRYLSISEQQQVEGYLAWKWGLQGSLPATHPYKNSPIPPLLNPPTTLPITIQGVWSPLQISGCQLWLDASDPSTITGSNPVSNWTDKSGTGKTITFSGTNTYNATNRSVNTNNASTSYFYANLNLKKSVVPYANVFIVHTWTGSGLSSTNQALWGQDIGGGWNRFQLLAFTAAPSLAYGLSYTPSSPNVVTVSNLNTGNRLLYSATYAYLVTNGTYAYVNGSLASSTVTEANSPSETSTTNTYFGTIDTGYAGTVAFHEILVYTSNLTTDQRQQIEGYLAWKWGLQRSLPANHPYFSYGVYFASLPINPRSVITYTGSWLPNQISGLQLWLDAKDTATITLSGTNVSQWRDKSGNAVSLNVSGTPTYNATQPAIVFTGSSYFQNTSFSFNLSSRSIFIVANGTGTNEGILALTYTTVDYNNTATLVYTDSGSKSIYLTENYPSGINASFTSPVTPVLVSDTLSNTLLSYYGNGSLVTTATIAATTSTGIIIGGRNDQGGVLVNKLLNGTINEIILMSPALTTFQRQQVEGYLAWKWGLQGSLPATHPYAKWPPSP